VKKIGRYEIERELGRGAMGVVYLARDPRVRRQVAIKTYHVPEGLKPEQEAEFRERFLREAQAAGALNHPAIVTIYDADDDPDNRTPFIAMEYVQGQSLSDLLSAHGSLAPDLAFDQAEAVAEALHEAHTAGIVHRDIKPANLLIPDGSAKVKVADFGVARMATSDLTKTGHSLGSPAYMSPEQVRGQPADGRSDLFSLAVVLYEALCGERPFKGDSLTALAYAVVHETPVPVSRIREGLPAGIDDFFDRALAKDPAKRFPDGLAFRDALRTARKGCVQAASQTLVVLPGEDTVAATADDSGDFKGPWVRGAEAAVHALRSTRRRAPGWAGKLRGADRRWLVAAAALVVVGVLSVGAWSMGTQRATLLVDGTNGFKSARLTVFVDGDAVYRRSLAAKKKKAAIMGRKLFNYGSEKYGGRIRVASGKHEIVAEVLPRGEDQPYRDRLVARLKPGDERRLEITTGKGLGSPVSIDLD
jgi:predicted Ser/Thr protein kinase